MKYEIWMEGFQSNGERGTASFVKTVEAESFNKACEKYYEGDTLFNKNNLTYWGCKLYDNENDARKNFG